MRPSIAALLVVGACATVPQGSPLAGEYRFAGLNGEPPPVEFPAGAGTRLEGGTLRLGPGDRFSLRFATRGAQQGTPVTSGHEGRFLVREDTLYFTPDGREDRPPETFHLSTDDLGLRLRDRQGNVWTYSRR